MPLLIDQITPVSGHACSNNVSILHGFQNTTTFTVYANARDLNKSSSIEKAVEITSHMRFLPIHV